MSTEASEKFFIKNGTEPQGQSAADDTKFGQSGTFFRIILKAERKRQGIGALAAKGTAAAVK